MQDILQAAHHLKEDTWFAVFQPLLLEIANTSTGKDLLCIEDKGLPIVRIKKNEVCYNLGGNELLSDFRTGSKWANVIRYRWEPFKSIAKRFYETEFEGQLVLRPLLVLNGVPVAAHATDTFYPDPDPESTCMDGNHNNADGTSFASCRNASSSSSVNDSGTTLRVMNQYNGGQYNIGRITILFDTSVVSSASSATLSVYGAGSNLAGGGQNARLVSSNPASNTSLAAGDYDQYGTTALCDTDLSFSTFGTTGYSSYALNATGLSAITGITKLGIRADRDILDTGQPGTGASNADVYSADQTGTANDPKLEVTYTAVATFIPRITIY